MRSYATRCPASGSPTRRRASAARCSRASSSRGSARCSAPRAPRTARSGRAWSPAKAPARPTTTSAVSPAAAGASRRQRDGGRADRGRGPRRHRAPPPAPTLIEVMFVRAFANPLLEPLADQALLAPTGDARLAFTTDASVVSPLFFAGGDIG